MTAAELIIRAERIAALRRFLLWCGVALLGLVFLGGIYCSGKAAGETSERLKQAKQETKAAEIVRHAAIETVTVRIRETKIVEAKALPLHDTVRVINSVTVAILVAPDSVVRYEVPEPVVSRIVADSQLIQAQRVELLAWRSVVAADSSVIRSQASTIRLLESSRQRCGRRCGFALGATASLALVWGAVHVVR